MKNVQFCSFDKTMLETYLWDDVTAPKGVVQILHGMAEHARRYDDFAKYLNASGYIVFADDHRAHGNTECEQDLGYHEGDIFEDTVSDEIAITEFLSNKYNLPVVVLGHSYGSFVAQRYLEKPSKACGIILSGSAYMKGLITNVGAMISNMQYKKGARKKGVTMDNLSFGGYNKPFKAEGVKFAWLSRDRAQVDKYMADKQCGYVMSNAFFKYFMQGLKAIYHPDNLSQISLNKPIAIFSGEKDPLGGKNAKLSYKLANMYKKLGVKNLSYTVYPSARHEILNEINKEEVYADMLASIDKFILA
ncbi:MAG: alpha/beta hydrolase [Clostridia bacterium]